MIRSFRLSIAAKLTIFIVLIVTLTAFAVSFVYFTGSSNMLVDKSISELEQEASFFKEPMVSSIQELKNDVVLLSEWPPIQGITRAKENNGVDPVDGSKEKEWFNRLETMFSAMLRTRPDYTQIRYIGVKENGKELLRIGRNNEGGII